MDNPTNLKWSFANVMTCSVQEEDYHVANLIVLVTKQYVYNKARCLKNKLSIQELLAEINIIRKVELNECISRKKFFIFNKDGTRT